MKMKAVVFGIILGLIAISSGLAYADSTYQIKGTGAAITNTDNPALYTSSMRLSLLDSSTIDKGSILVKGNDGLTVVRFTGDQWKFSYEKDGSFHGEGPAKTVKHDTFSVSFDGTRLFATGTGSMWKVSATMQDSAKKFVMN